VYTLGVVVLDVLPEQPPEMAVVHHDYVIE